MIKWASTQLYSRAASCWSKSLPLGRYGSGSGRSGFALIAVIWSLGLISLLGTAVIVDARYRTKVTSSDVSVLAASTAAESAVNLAIAWLLTGTAQEQVKFPLRCQMPGGERVIIDVEEETGKVDLNAAKPEVLARLFMAMTRDQTAGMRVAANIVAFRDAVRGQTADASPQPNSNKPDNSKKTAFTSIMQLDQIGGVSPRLFRTALRFVTVRSPRSEPDKDAASPALRMLLGLDQGKAVPQRAPPTTGSVTIRADVSAADGARFIREGLVLLGSDDGRPFRIYEWRHGDIDAKDAGLGSQGRGNAPVMSCFRIGRQPRGDT